MKKRIGPNSLVRHQRGFVAKGLALLAAAGGFFFFAVPAYQEHQRADQLEGAFKALSSVSLAAQLYWSSGKSYIGFDKSPDFPASNEHFGIKLADASSDTYLVTATGKNDLAGFVYSVNQLLVKATLHAPSGWPISDRCWIENSKGDCFK